MKKFLLSCCLALGIAGNAQISIVNDFETTSDYTGWYVAQSNTTHVTAPGNYNGGGLQCAGSRFFGFYFSTTATASVGTYGELYVLANDQAKVSNGQKMTIKFYPKSYATANTSYSTYYTLDNGATWIALTGTGAGTAPITCSEITIEIPAGIVPQGNSQFGFKLRTTKIAASPAGYGIFDNVRITQATLTVPDCTTVSTPVNDATNVGVRPTFSWTAANGATSYKLSVGTTAGGTNIINNLSLTSTSYTPTTAQTLQANTKYYVTVTATNENGDATNCTGSSFTTGINPATPYCGPLLVPSEVDPISNVSFAGIDNASSNTLNAGDGHEFFLGSKASVEVTKSYPIIVKGNVGGQYTDAVTVFVDWNHDGDFADANETFFTSAANGGFLLLRQTATGSTTQSTSNTLNITVPSDAVIGQTRMRIKKSYIGNSTVTATTALLTTAGIADPCSDQAYGQIEDYTVEVKEYLAVSDVNKANISVYPNPFTDILKISDVKGVKSVSINDVSGREVKTLAPSAELNLSSLKTGLYIVNLKMEDGSVKTFKAIKK